MATQSTSPQGLIDTLRERAQTHKRLSQTHRLLAQLDNETIRQLAAFCEAAGVDVMIEDRAPSPSPVLVSPQEQARRDAVQRRREEQGR